MHLTKKEVQHIADLARLELSKDETKIYGDQLSHILDYIDQLKEVDTTGIEPTAQVTGLDNVTREDNTTNWNEQELDLALKQAPKKSEKQIKVKKIL